MKLSFSVKGWQGLSWQQITDIALQMEFSGIELHSEYEEFKNRENTFSGQNTKAFVRLNYENRLTVPCIDTVYPLDGKNTAEICELIALAHELKVKYIAFHVKTEDTALIKSEISNLLNCAEKNKITLLIVTDDAFCDTFKLRELLDTFASDSVAALWDCRATCYKATEDPYDTIEHLGAYIKHVHLEDYAENGDYTAIGEGNMPIMNVMNALSSVDYDGYLSLQWNPSSVKGIDDYGIFLPHFVTFMRRFASENQKRRLYLNHDGTGRYIWKKDELIDLTFSRVLDRLVEEFPDQYAFKYTTLDYTRTYAEFRRDVDDFARSLISLGVKSGDKVSVWATNVPEWFIAFWAVTKIGAVLVSVNTAYKIHEIEYLLRQSDTHTLIMIKSSKDSDYAASINELCPEIASSKAGEPLHCKRLPFLRNVITVGFKMPGCLTFEEALQRKTLVPPIEVSRMAANVRSTDVCNMQYTSGTTGFPKGVMLTHYNVINNGKCIGDRMGLSTADRMMIQVPMFHCFGMVLSMTASLTHGTTVCPLPYFSAKASLDCINQEKITCFNGVPTMFIAMFNHPDYRKTDFSYMRTGIMAGSGCSPELMKRAADPGEMNMTGIVSVYGQTESAPGNTMSAWTDSLELRTETVGYPFPHVQCKVIDPETGEELPDGVNGEFCSRGYNVMKGYYKMAQATNSAIDNEGWLHSGDIAMRKPDGTYLITGRLKDMIIRGGENIYPKEIEEFIYTHEAVRDVQVIGVPDEKYGEEAAACIILKENQSVSEQEMRKYITEKLASHKVPKYILFVDSFPMNAAGKVLKYKMRENVIKLLQN
ncbi:MAG: AMP-binding protein [Clostridiales bacterium]|nr:AMP-binding protein [Candidatus Equinaster intestinalis]